MRRLQVEAAGGRDASLDNCVRLQVVHQPEQQSVHLLSAFVQPVGLRFFPLQFFQRVVSVVGMLFVYHVGDQAEGRRRLDAEASVVFPAGDARKVPFQVEHKRIHQGICFCCVQRYIFWGAILTWVRYKDKKYLCES